MPAEQSRFFRASVRSIQDITPSFRRFTFTSQDLADYGDPGYDQRIKVVFGPMTADPGILPVHDLEAMPTGPDWYQDWRSMPEHERPPFRTYTTRAVRREVCEVDIDMVVHEVSGPASQWIQGARPGDEVLIFGPTTAATGVSFGIDFVPPENVGHVLLVGDETAAPAIACILEQYPDVPATVVLELPHEHDINYLPRRPDVRYVTGSRAGRERNEFLVSATKEVIEELNPPGHVSVVEEIPLDEILWEVPRSARGGAALKSAELYTWLAGEASAVRELRRHLVGVHGVDRRAVAFMGYWRLGRAEV
ncbi:siderophore-interacting protein [Populibacterium corticicola]|uniref:Siderophore-interacting protein n=1 Tax=Populibacterium corticicola TaxID=1812826 RepID=A0ABW5XFZ2_9MICO